MIDFATREQWHLCNRLESKGPCPVWIFIAADKSLQNTVLWTSVVSKAAYRIITSSLLGPWPSYLIALVSLRLVGAVGARNYVRISLSKLELSITRSIQDLSILSHASSHWPIPLFWSLALRCSWNPSCHTNLRKAYSHITKVSKLDLDRCYVLKLIGHLPITSGCVWVISVNLCHYWWGPTCFEYEILSMNRADVFFKGWLIKPQKNCTTCHSNCDSELVEPSRPTPVIVDSVL